MPTPGDLPHPSARETGAVPPLVPLFIIEPFEFIDGSLQRQDVDRYFDSRDQLKEYFDLEANASREASLEHGMPHDRVHQIERILDNHFLPSFVIEGPGAAYFEHVRECENFFAELEKSGECSQRAIRLLKLSEFNVRKKHEIEYAPPLKYIQYINSNRIWIPQVTQKVLNLWNRRKDVPDGDDLNLQINHLNENRVALVAAIKEQILDTYLATQ